MFLINGTVLSHDFTFLKLDIEINDQAIVQIAPHLAYPDDALVVDCTGYLLAPGFVDIHIHGCVGADASDGTRDAIETMAKHLLTKGVTSFCPTTMTLPWTEIVSAVETINACMLEPCDGAAVLGVNLEGPFLSKERCGAQNTAYIAKPDYAAFSALIKQYPDVIRLISIAPEEDKEFAFIQQASNDCVIAIAHTTADFATATNAIAAGISHATHLFNAMTGLTHREPGAVGAIFSDKQITAELICDGVHIHPAALKLAFKLLGDRAVIISDAMRASGLETDTVYDLGGQAVHVENGVAKLSDGALAGSISNLHEEVKNLVRYGISPEEAIKAASITPARVVGKDHLIGSLMPGKRADILVLDNNLDICAVYH